MMKQKQLVAYLFLQMADILLFYDITNSRKIAVAIGINACYNL